MPLTNNEENFLIGLFQDVMKYSQGVKEEDNMLIIDRTAHDYANLTKIAADNLGLKSEVFSMKKADAYKKFPEKLHEHFRKNMPKASFGWYDYSGLEASVAGDETNARVDLIRRTLTKVPTGSAHIPGPSYSMFLEGAGRCTPKELIKIGKKPLEILNGKGDEKIEYVHITSRHGTDLKVWIPEIVKWQPDYIIRPPGPYEDEPGVIGNFPFGEIFAEKDIDDFPVLFKAEGEYVSNVSIGHINKLIDPEKPVVLRFGDGKLVKMECDDSEIYDNLSSRIKTWGSADKKVAEVGIGLNKYARKTGNLLEDEKLHETVHIALDTEDNIGNHTDFITDKPTFVARRVDGYEVEIMKDGILRI